MENLFQTPVFMTPDFFGRFDGLRKYSTESAKRLEGLNLKVVENLMKKQAEIFTCTVDTGNKAAAVLGEGKQLPEIFSEQAKLASDYSSRLLSLMQETGSALAECQGDYRAWLEDSYKEFGAQWQSLAADFIPSLKPKT